MIARHIDFGELARLVNALPDTAMAAGVVGPQSHRGHGAYPGL